MSSWKICWSSKQEPAVTNVGAPGIFGCNVGDEGYSPVKLVSEGGTWCAWGLAENDSNRIVLCML